MLKRFAKMAMVPALIAFVYGLAASGSFLGGIIFLFVSFGYLLPLYGALLLIAFFTTVRKMS